MKKLIFITIILTIVLGCEQKKESKELTTPKVQKIPDSILVFAKQYNAIVGWDTLDKFPTLQPEEVIKNKKRPIFNLDRSLLGWSYITILSTSPVQKLTTTYIWSVIAFK